MAEHTFIPYGRQFITQQDIDAVVEVLQSDFLTQGPAIECFEKAVCAHTGARFAVAVNSATSGLHIGCMALGIGEGDLVWTSPISFVATSNAALFCGADVDFVDIDPETYNMSVSALESKLRVASKEGKLPKLVIPVHMCGASCDMKAIQALSEQYGFQVMEDAAHAIGASYKQGAVGDCAYSDLAVFSFHPVKIITTAEGGLVTTNNEELYNKLLRLRTHGITREPDQLVNESHGGWYYEMLELSYNYRMTDMQAALGTSQMQHLDALVSRRNDIARRYVEVFTGTSIGFQSVSDDCLSSYHLFPIQVPGGRKREIFDQFRAGKIGVNLHYIPIYLQPYYQRLGFAKGLCPNAERYYEQAISIPLFPQMTDDDVEYVAQKAISYLNKIDP